MIDSKLLAFLLNKKRIKKSPLRLLQIPRFTAHFTGFFSSSVDCCFRSTWELLLRVFLIKRVSARLEAVEASWCCLVVVLVKYLWCQNIAARWWCGDKSRFSFSVSAAVLWCSVLMPVWTEARCGAVTAEASFSGASASLSSILARLLREDEVLARKRCCRAEATPSRSRSSTEGY